MFSLQQLRMRKSNFDMELPIVHHGVGGQSTMASAGFYRTTRWLCLLTTCLAFLLGVGVGVAVPIFVYALPINSLNNNTMLLVSTSTTLPVEFVLKTSSSNVSDIVDSDYTEKTVQPAALQVKNRLSKLRRWRDNVRTNSITQDEKIQSPNSVVSFIAAGELVEQSESPAGSRPTSADVVNGEAVQGIYWSQAVEDMLPTGFSQKDAEQWQAFSRQSPVVKLEEGCGRMQNRLITYENGTRSCCRYRQNYDQIQGEIFSYYLSRLLGLPNLPPSALGLIRSKDEQWNNVRSSMNLAHWTEERPVVYTRFLDDLEPAYIPEQLRGVDRHLNPADVQHIQLSAPSAEQSKTRDQLITLAQWSDLIVLDYLTANLDRVVNNMYNLQWNPAMMDSPAHNLARNTQTGLLVFLDNESGLLHGYRLLDKYEVYHKSLLDSVCIFRRSTVQALRSLQAERKTENLLRSMFESQDSLLVDYLPFLPEKSLKTLNHRIDRVLDQVAKCKTIYGDPFA